MAEWDGRPLNPERDGWHWLLRRGAASPESWRWDPDADGCGTDYSGAWAEADGDGQPDDLARYYTYLGPCLKPSEVAAQIEQARQEGAEEMRKAVLAGLRNAEWQAVESFWLFTLKQMNWPEGRAAADAPAGEFSPDDPALAWAQGYNIAMCAVVAALNGWAQAESVKRREQVR